MIAQRFSDGECVPLWSWHPRARSMASSSSAEPGGEGKLLLVTMAAAPCRGRLSTNVLDALEVDDVHGTSRWLQDPSTHIEDTESTKRQTALIWAARHGAEQCVRLLLDAGARVDAEMAAGYE